MKSLYLTLLLFALGLSGFAQLNMTHLGTLPYLDSDTNIRNLSDCWGYVDEAGNEYALVGVYDGFSLVNVTDPTDPDELLFLPGPESTWRDLKVWGDYAYITNETSGGMLIVNLSPLPNNPVGQSVNYTGSNFPFNSAHNLFIDENGYCYVFGADYGAGGAIILNLNNNPMQPEEVAVIDDYYFHDGFVRGDTLWFGAVYDGISGMIDVSDKNNHVIMGTWDTPNVFSHNIWPSDDGQYAFTTDEVTGGYIAAYDVSNPNNVTEVDRFQSSPGSGVIPHNTHFLNDYLITSYYTDGISIVDCARPNNLVDVGNYDTAPDYSGDGFNGSWGAYPYLPSGNILAADIQEGLVIMAPTYVRGCYLEGVVTDSICGIPLSNVSVNIVSSPYVKISHANGSYSAGMAVAGTYDVTFSKLGYMPVTVSGVSLSNGNLTTLNVKMFSTETVSMQGSAMREGTPIEGTQILLQNDSLSYNFTADGNGEFEQCNVLNAEYEATVTRWGYISQCFEVTIDAQNSQLDIELDLTYYDDFTTHLGWSIDGDAGDGQWARNEPNGTSLGGTQSNPEEDLTLDCGENAYVTGNSTSGNPYNDDIDFGMTRLTSPVMDLTLYEEPQVQQYLWFLNAGGNDPANDYFRVLVTNGTDTAMVLELDTNTTMSSWEYHEFNVTDYVSLTNSVQVIYEAADVAPDNVVEAGLDGFVVIETSSTPIGVEAVVSSEMQAHIYPNPTAGTFNIDLAGFTGSVAVELHDVSGRLVAKYRLADGQRTAQLGANLTDGLYLMRVTDAAGNATQTRLVKH